MGRGNEEGKKEGEYGWGTFYTCMNMEHIYGNVTMKTPV
jgi:hypothetical protein